MMMALVLCLVAMLFSIYSSADAFSTNPQKISRAPPSKICAATELATANPLVEYDSLKSVPGGVFVDEAELLSKSTFAIKPDDLVRLTKKVLLTGVGLEDESVLANNFEFCAPFVGPLKKEEYVNALKGFKLLEAFPDMDNQFHFIRVDPFEHNRVWWHSRSKATHTGGPLLGKAATGKALQLPPQANSFRFNEQGQVEEVTVGYVLDRRSGNTGGLGGAFGYFYGVGNPLPIPECQPYKKSWQFSLLGKIGELGKILQKIRGA